MESPDVWRLNAMLAIRQGGRKAEQEEVDKRKRGFAEHQYPGKKVFAHGLRFVRVASHQYPAQKHVFKSS